MSLTYALTQQSKLVESMIIVNFELLKQIAHCEKERQKSKPHVYI